MRNKSVQDLKGKAILFVGGSGFFGKSVLDYVNDQKLDPRPEFIIVSRGQKSLGPDQWPHLKITHVQSGIESLSKENLPSKIDFIIHGATSTNTEGQDEAYLEKTLVQGTKNLLTIASELKPQGVLFLSSGAVYGLGRTEPIKIKESDQHFAPTTEPYGSYKLKAENLCADFYHSSSIPVSIARCFAFSGNHLPQDSHFAITNFIRDGKSKADIVIKGNGKAARSYMDQSDLAEWLITIMMKNDQLDIVNVGSPEAVSIRDLAGVVATFFPEIKISVLGQGNIPQNFYVPDTSKAFLDYGLSLKVSLRKSIERMIKVVGL